MPLLNRPTADEYPPYFERYLSLVGEGDLLSHLEQNLAGTLSLLGSLSEAQGDHRYAPDKWTVKQVLGHLCDTERVMAYRLLRAARGDAATPLPGYDDDAWAATRQVGHLPLRALAQELQTVRAATVCLLGTLTEPDWSRTVLANGQSVSARALASMIAGHEVHHRRILVERYL